MGGCASKPKDLATAEKAPAPVEAPAPLLEKVEPETVAAPQETKDGDDTVVAEPAAKAEEAEAAAVRADEPTEEKKEVAEVVATA